MAVNVTVAVLQATHQVVREGHISQITGFVILSLRGANYMNAKNILGILYPLTDNNDREVQHTGCLHMSHLISGGGHSDSRPEPARRDGAETGAELPGPGLPAAGGRPAGALSPPTPRPHVQGLPQQHLGVKPVWQ